MKFQSQPRVLVVTRNKIDNVGMPLIGLIYTRVSTTRQAENGYSLDEQEKICRAFAISKDIIIPDDGVFREEGESAKTADRTQLKKILTILPA